jgi:hypothetical protein
MMLKFHPFVASAVGQHGDQIHGLAVLILVATFCGIYWTAAWSFFNPNVA